MAHVLKLSVALLLTLALRAHAAPGTPMPAPDRRYGDVIAQVVGMPQDGELQGRTSRLGLNVVNVMWEDTGRDAYSAVGPNISDLTLQVRESVDGAVRTHLLPVIRYPNFTDTTGDVRADKLWVRVGNQRQGGGLESVRLTDVLRNIKRYLSNPDSLRGNGSFLAKRDTHFLVSAQHVFVPLPKGGKAEFNPVLFNYQSAVGSPAVLTLLVTREGLSATVIENRPGDQTLQGWGQQLFFNNAGQKTVFTAERKSDVRSRIDAGGAKPADAGALDEGADMMMVVQVPLKHQQRGYMMGLSQPPSSPSAMASGAPSEMARRSSDVEAAVLGHGEDMGPFVEMNGLTLERDDRFPVRVTVQFYRATSNGVVSDDDLTAVHALIQRVYKDADYVGSLVVPEGKRHRPTDWIKDQPRFSPWGILGG